MKLERLTSNALIPSLARLRIQEDLSRLLDSDGQKLKQPKATTTDVAQALHAENTTDYEEVVISWQQKLFSQVDIVFIFDHLRYLLFNLV